MCSTLALVVVVVRLGCGYRCRRDALIHAQYIARCNL
jgi:hypothetical protein